MRGAMAAGLAVAAASPALADLELTPFAQKVADEVRPGGKGTVINGMTVAADCRGSRGNDCSVWAPPEMDLSAKPPPGSVRGKVTSKAYLDIRIVRDYNKEVLEDGVLRGRVVFGLYGEDSPKTAKQFLQFVSGEATGPTFASALFYKHTAGKYIEGGRISGFIPAPEIGFDAWDWGGKVISLNPVLEANNLKHDAPLLLSHKKLNPGPSFAVTLGPVPEMDGDWTVLGEVLEGKELIQAVANLPYITGKSLDPSGSVSDQWWTAQNKYFLDVAKALGDTRVANKYPGKLLRRVEVYKCGVL